MLFPQELFLSPDSRAALPLPCVEMQAGMRDALSLRLAEQSKEVQFPRSFRLLCIPPQDSRQYFYVLLALLMSIVKTRLEVKLEQHREEWDNPFPILLAALGPMYTRNGPGHAAGSDST